MAMTRRDFGKMLAAVTVALGAGLWPTIKKVVPVRFVRAVTTGRFPGRLRPLADADVKKPAPWSG